MNNVKRKLKCKFPRSLSVILIAVLIVILSACSQATAQVAQTSPQASSLPASPSASGIPAALLENVPTACPTVFVDPEIEGPFYKTGSPERTDLVEPGIPGDPILVTGYVLDKNCNPVAGAWVDFWQADGNGTYDNSGYKLRGHQFTDSQGRYVLRTVMPGEYPGRTNHIHVKLSPSAGGSNLVTTQIYFPDISANSKDSIFNSTMLVTWGNDINGEKVAYFNFKMDW